jgi:N-acetylglucosaminyl-diphospho-decaprenol L-rhamnosyltransferase
MTHKNMDVSLIILNYKSKGLVHQCIKTVKLYPSKAAVEIIVVDNASEDGIGKMLAERHPDVRFIPSPVNGGFAHGNNLGLAAAKGRYALIMNPDITVRAGAIDELVTFMDAHPDVGVCGPKLVRPDGSLDDSCYREPTIGIPAYRRTPLGRLPAGRKAVAHYTMADKGRDETMDVDWLLGAVLMVRREALLKVGMLDERYFLYFEDADWCRRFRDAGYRVVYHPESEMVHYHERLSAQGSWLTSLFRKSARVHIASAFKYFWKWRKKR